MRATLLIIALLAARPATATDFAFTETFDNPKSAAENWHVFAGKWEFEPGQARQLLSDFDCGAARQARIDAPYYLEVEFTPQSTFNGAGLFFGLTSGLRKHGGMMVRCDPGSRVIWGHFDEAGMFEFYNEATTDDPGQTLQTLAVAVDPQNMAFNIFHNGEKVAENIKTYEVVGYIGMQTSGGPHTFSRVTLRPATENELAGIKPPGKYSRILNVIGSSSQIVALRRAPKFLAAYDPSGNETARTHVTDIAGLGKIRFNPISLTWDRHAAHNTAAGVYVLAESGSAIYHYDSALRQIGDGPLVRDETMRGVDLAVGPHGHIFVADSTIPGIRVFDAQGQERLVRGEKGGGGPYDRVDKKWAGKFEQPTSIAISPAGDIVITDRGQLTYQVYAYDHEANELTWVSNGPWLPHPDGADFDSRGRLLLAHTYEYYRSHGALRVMSLDGRAINVYRGYAINDLSDHARVCAGPRDQYYIFDPSKERFVILPTNFVERPPAFEWTTDGGVKLTLTKADGTTTTSVSNERNDAGRVVVQPAEPPCDAWPPLTPADLRTYQLPPAPPPGARYVIDMPVLVAIFTRATDHDGKRLEIDADRQIVERLRRELEVDREFYWRNSHATLNKFFDYMLIDEVTPALEGGWINPSAGRDWVNKVREQRGMDPISNEHSLVVIHPMQGFDPDITDEPGWVSGGGLTLFGYSGYALWNNGQGWLMGHEWGHQLDAYFERSNVTDWWLNHPDGTVHVGRYGEHWDCNAYLCRRMDLMNWLRLQFGMLRLVDDADGDGLADRDGSLPIDEQRFGSNPARADTDGDGLGDLAELTAGIFSSADPTKPDTDGDGMLDGDDPYPQFAVATSIPSVVSSADQGRLGTLKRGWCDVDVFAAYDQDHVHVTFIFNEPADAVHVTADFKNDGWFIGRDNVYAHASLEWPADASPKVRGAHNCEAVLHEDGRPQLRLTIKRPATRDPLKPGSEIGLTVRVTGKPGQAAFLIDPWQILGLRLH